MSKNVVLGLVACAGLAGVASTASGQAVGTSAQLWDVQFRVTGAGPSTTQVNITILARVGIIGSTANLGVARVGGAGPAGTAPFTVAFNDALSAGLNLSQGNIARGLTGETRGGNVVNDSTGAPLAGAFLPFRGSFAPQGQPFAQGANTDANNGLFQNTGTGAPANNAPSAGVPTLTNVVLGRSLNYGADGTQATGVASVTGNAFTNAVGSDAAEAEYTRVFSITYFPRPDFTSNAVRNINVSVANIGVRYTFAASGSNSSASGTFNLGGRTFSFQVPTPGAAAVLGLGALAAARRRRA